jgi:hypothetical protein
MIKNGCKNAKKEGVTMARLRDIPYDVITEVLLGRENDRFSEE